VAHAIDDPRDDIVRPGDQCRAGTIGLAKLKQQDSRPVPFAVADRLQQTGITHGAEQTRRGALRRASKGHDIRHCQFQPIRAEASENLGGSIQNAHSEFQKMEPKFHNSEL
jgi:hypothetical protein